MKQLASKPSLFVIPVIKMEHGYYATEMQVVPLGKIKGALANDDLAKGIP